MAISLLSNLSYLGEDYNFSRDAFKTIAEMKAFDADYLPPMYLSYCEEDGKVYLYNDNNTEDAITGKWRVFGEGGEGTDEIYIGDTQPTDDNITMWIDTSPDVDNIFKYYDGTEYKTIAPITKLELLADVELTDLADGQFVKWDETEEKWVNTDITHSVVISDTEPTNEEVKVWVDTTGDNAVIKYRTTDGFASIEAVSELSKLTDVSLDDTTLAEGQIIKYDATNEKWINADETKEIHVGTTEPTDENIEFWIDTSEKYDEEYFAQEDIVSVTPIEPTTDSNKVWIDTTNTKAVLKYKDGDEYKAIGAGGGTAEETTYTNTSFDDIENVKQALDKLYAKVYYVPLAFTSFVMTPSATVYEKGSSVNDVTVTWGFNKDITDQKLWLNDERLYGGLESRYYRDGAAVTSDYEIKITASDGETTVTKSATISFQNKIYWGSSATVDNYNSSFILALANKKFATSKAGNLSFNVAENEYGFLAMPSSFGSPTCVINNFETELEDLGTVSFTNASGYTENYKLYKTTQDSLGAFTATIK